MRGKRYPLIWRLWLALTGREQTPEEMISPAERRMLKAAMLILATVGANLLLLWLVSTNL